MSEAQARATGYHAEKVIGAVQGRLEGAVGAIQDNTLGHLMRQWSVVEALQIGRMNPVDVRKFYYCADHDCSRYIARDERARAFQEACAEQGRDITHTWSYIEIDGTKADQTIASVRSKKEVAQRLAGVGKERARVVIARGLVVADKKSNSGVGEPLFGEIAIGLMSRVENAPHEFTYLVGAALKLDSPERFYVEDRLDESKWVSRAQAAKFRGVTVDIIDGNLR